MLLLTLLACATPGVDTGLADDPRDPSHWDCTASSIPERTSPVDPSCMTDPLCPERLVAGHRGMGATLGKIAPENSLAAVRAAIAYGVDYVETDPRPTADGVLVNVHDTSVDRTTDGSGKVAEMSLAEVQALHLDTSFTVDADFSCERVPTLVEVLETARGRVHVLVDANKTDRVDLLVQAILDTDTLEWALFDTSSVDKIDRALAIEPSLRTMIRVDSSEELEEQLAHFAAHPPVIVEVPERGPALAPAVVEAGQRPFSDIFLTDLDAWDEDDPALYAHVYDDGLRIVQSDRPELVLEQLGR